MVSEDGVTSRQYASGIPQSSCISEHVYFARPDSRIFGRGCRSRATRWAANSHASPACPPMWSCPCPTPASPPRSATLKRPASFPVRLIRNHYVGRTFIEPEQRVRDFGVRLKLNPVHISLQASASSSLTIHHPRNDEP